MVWCPSFQSAVRADARREYRVGHELIDEFLEFASGRPGDHDSPTTAWTTSATADEPEDVDWTQNLHLA